MRAFINAAVLVTAVMLFLSASFALAAEPKTHVVNIDSMKFEPAVLKVQIGDTVIWRNDDIVPHTATALTLQGKKPVFESGEIGAEQEFKLKIVKGMTGEYICRFHPTMRGKLIVFEGRR